MVTAIYFLDFRRISSNIPRTKFGRDQRMFGISYERRYPGNCASVCRYSLLVEKDFWKRIHASSSAFCVRLRSRRMLLSFQHVVTASHMGNHLWHQQHFILQSARVSDELIRRLIAPLRLLVSNERISGGVGRGYQLSKFGLELNSLTSLTVRHPQEKERSLREAIAIWSRKTCTSGIDD